MRKGDIVINPWVSAYFNGELDPNYATIYLGDNKSLDYNGRVCEWADKIYKDNPKRNTPWKVIGHIDLYGIAELAIRDAVFAEEVADTPQTDLLVKTPRKSRESHEKDCETCRDKDAYDEWEGNCDECENGSMYTPQTDCPWK